MKIKQRGFTLIELVVVIIILGILAVVAAPKFLNFQGDARVSALQGLKGALQSANSMVYAKAAIAGQEGLAFNATPTAPAVDIGTGTNAVTSFGYLQATEAELENATEMTFDSTANASGTEDWLISTPSPATTPASIVIRQRGAPETCSLTYTQAASATVAPVYSDLPTAANCS
ncbi:MAG: type II secretion system protein [Parashewanella sp.]